MSDPCLCYLKGTNPLVPFVLYYCTMCSRKHSIVNHDHIQYASYCGTCGNTLSEESKKIMLGEVRRIISKYVDNT